MAAGGAARMARPGKVIAKQGGGPADRPAVPPLEVVAVRP